MPLLNASKPGCCAVAIRPLSRWSTDCDCSQSKYSGYRCCCLFEPKKLRGVLLLEPLPSSVMHVREPTASMRNPAKVKAQL